MSFFFFSSRRRHTRLQGDWSSDVCSSDLSLPERPTVHSAVLPAVTPDSATDFLGLNADADGALGADGADGASMIVVLMEGSPGSDRNGQWRREGRCDRQPPSRTGPWARPRRQCPVPGPTR